MADESPDPKHADDPSSPWYGNPDWTPPDGYQYYGYTWNNGQPSLAPTNAPGTPGYDPTQPSWHQPNAPGTIGGTPPPPTVPSPTGGGGGTPAPSAPGGSLIRPFPDQPPQTPGTGTDYIPGTPRFNGPAPRTPDPFKAPSADDVFNEPGFLARLRGGTDRLQNWAAAKGTLNDSGTAKALIDYGQGEASQEYGNVWDRAYNAYNANVGTQYVLPWQEAFQNAQEGNQNDLTGYKTQAGAAQYQKNADYLDQYNTWLSKWNIYDKNQEDTFNRQYKLLTT